MILHQHEAAESGAEMAIAPLWQRCQDGLSVRRDPAFTLVTGGTRRNHQVLHQKRLMTLEARSFCARDVRHLLLDADPRRHLAAEPRFCVLMGFGRSVAWSMPLGLIVGRPFRPFGRAISSRCNNSLFQNGNLAEQFNQQSLKGWTA